ncbi:MAG: T9SS type A sorting domain-containing protein [candidate division Zixibacteria bacterium]|nr:T9SS type A sorting domain-containing protein [candidate division Zixibacteria bacterium]
MNRFKHLASIAIVLAAVLSLWPLSENVAQCSVIEHNIKFDNYNIRYDYSGNCVKIDYKDFDKISNAGEPALPYSIVKLLIPQGEDIDSVVLSGDYKVIPGYYNIEHAQHPIKTSALEPPPPLVSANNEIYNSVERYPAEDFEIVDEGYFGNNHIVTLIIYPIVYYPSAQRLEYSPSLDIRLFTNPAGASGTTLLNARPVESEILSKIVDNYGTAMHYANAYPSSMLRNPPSGFAPLSGNLGYEYVIITSAALAENYEPILEWKKRKGLVAGIVTIEEIEVSYTGIDLQEKIRNYLIEAYEYGLVWVLLGGDESVIPIRYAYHNNTSSQPELVNQQICDLYYSDLTGEWDVDGDGIYGEPSRDNPDIYPEVYVGRLPIATAEEIDAYTEKLFMYTQNPGNGNFSYLTSALFISSDQLASCNQQIYLGDEMPGNFLVDTTSLVERPSGYSENPTSPTGEQVIDRMNDGFGFISNLNHGSPQHYACMAVKYNNYPKSYVISDTLYGETNNAPFTYLDENSKYGVHYSISCDVGAIDMDQGVWPWQLPTNSCLAESYVDLTRKGGVAFLGNGRWGWVATSYKLERGFIQTLFGDDPFSRHVAVAEAISKTMFPTYRDLNYGHLLYGDPELIVWDRIPQLLSANYETEIPARQTSYRVIVESYGEVLEGMKVCIYKEDGIFSVGYTDTEGRVFLDINPQGNGPLKLTVTGDGYIPYLAEISVIPSTDISDEVESIPYEFKLDGNYPNPFNASTTIEYSLDQQSEVRLTVYDIAGRIVNQTNLGTIEAGNHHLQWLAQNANGQELASGMYLYSIKAGDKSAVEKMTLVK